MSDSPDSTDARAPSAGTRIALEEVRQIALLARLALGEADLLRLQREIDAILGHIDVVRQLDTTGVLPMTHAVPFDCPLRPDEVQASLSVDEALRNAPRREGSYFLVPRIVPGPAGEKGEP
jgi:aspartyl-tRNA(Asn)/glutamyl-tRNA(Gln) amidotransferase subunit C